MKVAHEIQQWLVPMAADTSHPLWLWGVDLFWVAFTAAFPNFLRDTMWPLWSADIPFCGAYLTQYFRTFSSFDRLDGVPDLKELRIRAGVWQEFVDRVTLVGFPVF